MQPKIPQQAFDWYDDYAHGRMDRRTFLSKLASLAALGYSLPLLTSALLPNYARAEQVSFNDPTIVARFTEFDSPKGHGKGRGYLVRPADLQGKRPVILVIHENRGLNPYIQDVARRLAKQGYIAFAPDALFPLGGYPGNDDEGRTLQRSLDRDKILQDFMAAAQFVKDHEHSNGKLGAIGFCFGGYVVNYLAAQPGLLAAGVPFYGTPADQAMWGNIRIPLQLHFAELDSRVNATWPDYEQHLLQSGVDYQAFFYQGANHGFHNDSTARYDKASAELAWQRSLDFFKAKLGA